MPSATSSSSSSSSSSRHQSVVVSSPRERTEVEELRRRTVDVVPEELDRELGDRPDWPLASPESAEEMREERAVEGAVMRKPEDFGVQLGGGGGGEYGYAFDEHDVSDIEEEDEDLEEVEEDDDVMMPTSSSLSQSPSQLRSQDSPFHLHPHPSPSPVESHRAALQALESPQRHVSPQPDVSPIREREGQQLLHASSNGSLSTDHNHNIRTDHNHQQEDQYQQQQPLRHRQSNVELRLNGQSTLSLPDDDDGNASQESRDTLAIPPTAAPSTPRTNNSPVLQQGSRLSFHALPSPNNTNRNSLAKAPMHSPPHRRTSTRSSHNPYNTTQTPSNKERLRYSWQSLQDDEPNRPRIHIIKLVSNTATASAGFPAGEAFGFSISPGGRRIAAYNSARLYVLQTAALPVGISQDYALKRRPLAVELTDEGNSMAILSDDHTVNIYDLGGHQLRRTRTIKLDFPTNCIALAPTGGLLAAAYEGGVEIFSLDANALPTDRRAVRSIRMDRMTFSEDGSTLLGTTTRVNVSSTVVVSVPIFPASADGIPTHAELKEAWCSELLHPENIRTSSHAVFMRESSSRSTCNERVFAWNGLEDTFGILSVADLHYGNVDFPVVISPPLSTCGGLGAAIHSCPAVDEGGDTVAMIVNDRTIRLYIVPAKVEDGGPPVEAHSIDHELDEGYGCPFSEVRWVYSSASLPAPPPPAADVRGAQSTTPVKGRLIVTSPGGVSESSDENFGEDIEGGRIILFDFDPQFQGQPGQTFCLTLGKSPPAVLEEEDVDLSEQIQLVRRRTVNQSQRGGLSQRPTMLGRAATTYGGRRPNATAGLGSGRNHRTSMLSIGTLQSDGARSLPDLLESTEQAEIYEEPYIQGAPRSHASLQRAASNAQRHRYQALEERNRESISVDSTGNFLPLPEYTEEPNAPLPQRFRALAGLDGPSMGGKVGGQGVPQSAPPDVGEHFSADAAFRTANANAMQQTSPLTSAGIPPPRPETSNSFYAPSSQNQNIRAPSIRSERSLNGFYPTLRGGEREFARPASPATSTHTLNSVRSQQGTLRPGPYGTPAFLPRSLQRAYSNAVHPPPAFAHNVGLADGRSASRAGNASAMGTYYAGSVNGGSVQEEEEEWDAISPVGPSGPMSPFGQRVSVATNPSRLSQRERLESRNGSVVSGSTEASHLPPSSSALGVAGGRRLPPHMEAFRRAAAANANANANADAAAIRNAANVHESIDDSGTTLASASLFPATVPRDQIPLRKTSVGAASTVRYPVTGWRPPAPSLAPPGSAGSGGSAGTKMTGRKKRGLFGKREKVEEKGSRNGQVWMAEEKGREKEKCVVM